MKGMELQLARLREADDAVKNAGNYTGPYQIAAYLKGLFILKRYELEAKLSDGSLD